MAVEFDHDDERHPAETVDPDGRRLKSQRVRDAGMRRGLTLRDEELSGAAALLSLEAPTLRLEQRPRVARWLNVTRWRDEERPALSFVRELAARTAGLGPGDVESFDRILRVYRQREMMRIAWRDLTRRAPLRVVTREISHLADALVGCAVAFHDRVLAARHGPAFHNDFCVVAMGKHGARELNYSSDIDVLFLCRDDAPERIDRATALVRAVSRSLDRVTAHGFCFRVDANLRPYGRDGALVNTPDALERYYERAGQSWERAALIKARPCAGGLELGQEALARLRPFVFRRSLDLEAVEALAQMKRRIDLARSLSPTDDVKLGQGGIREVEFFVQAFQLLHGGRHPRLQVRGTLEAMEALVYAGFVAADDRDVLAAAYVFLREVEHRLQLPDDRQTQQLPAIDTPARRQLAARMGFRSSAAFEAELTRHREAVHQRFAGLLASAEERGGHPPEVDVALANEEPDGVREAALVRLGFTDAEPARAALVRLSRQSDGAFGPRGRERHPRLAEKLLHEIARSPAPDLALLRLAQLATPLWDPAALASLLSASTATARLLVLLFATSESLSRDFRLHPELLDALVRADGAVLEKSAGTLQSEVAERLSRQDDPEARLSLLRRVRHEETLRIGLHDLSGRLGAVEVGRQLSMVAEVLVGQCLSLARSEVAQRYGEPADAGLCVLGMGSLGGREMTYESDLDLVVVHEAHGQTSGGTRGAIEAAEWASRVVQKLLSHLTLSMTEGVLYRVDSRLRPSGSAGPLAASLEAFGAYHRRDDVRGREAALWERQALLRARPVAGESRLCERVEREVLDVVAAAPLPADAGHQVAEMRRALDSLPPGGVDPKKGPGGVLDVEFAVQVLLLRAGLRIASTREALERLALNGAIDPARAGELSAGWTFLRRVESRLRLVYGRAEVYVPQGGDGLRRLARQLGDDASDGGERLMRDLSRTMRRMRELFDQLTVDG